MTLQFKGFNVEFRAYDDGIAYRFVNKGKKPFKVVYQTLDEDVVDEIYDYFMEEAESDSLEAAMEDLKDDYDEQEVRLVRIKFLCEVAN